jgi:hypothetical protein
LPPLEQAAETKTRAIAKLFKVDRIPALYFKAGDG